MTDTILLIGCGKMGGALLGGLIRHGHPPAQIIVLQPSGKVPAEYGVRVVTSAEAIPADVRIDTVLCAVKPQMMESVLPSVAKHCKAATLFISVAAGKKLAFYESLLGAMPIVRAMPNLPAVVGKGVTVVCGNDGVDGKAKARAEALFSAVGSVYWLEDEAGIDAVTAISGSGPAYVFYFMEALVGAATKLGLPEDLAILLTQSTVAGSAQLAETSPLSFTALKEQVISPKGTTEAGLRILSADHALERLLEDTAQAACARSKELAG